MKRQLIAVNIDNGTLTTLVSLCNTTVSLGTSNCATFSVVLNPKSC